MWWYAFACLWCASVGFLAGLWVGWFSTAPKLTEQRPEFHPSGIHHGTIERLRPIDLRPVSRN